MRKTAAGEEEKRIRPVGRIHTDFPEKFGVPRQSGIAKTIGSVHFEREYRSLEAIRALEGFSYIWLIFGFDRNNEATWHPTVRPPRLGGNERVGVFASRSPFRPNGLGLSSVRLLSIDTEAPDAPVLFVEGADLVDGTPIYDIKPYLPDFDIHPDARGGYASTLPFPSLKVNCDEATLQALPEAKREGLMELLSADPRPAYQDDPERIYGMSYAGFTVQFTVQADTLTVKAIIQEA